MLLGTCAAFAEFISLPYLLYMCPCMSKCGNKDTLWTLHGQICKKKCIRSLYFGGSPVGENKRYLSYFESKRMFSCCDETHAFLV